MMETLELHKKPLPVQDTRKGHTYHTRGKLSRPRMVGVSLADTLVRFVLVGGLNTLVDLLMLNALWANVSKVIAIGGTAVISYLGMRLWVFVSKRQQEQTLSHAAISASNEHQSTSLAPERHALTKIKDDQTESCMVGATLAVALAPINGDLAPINGDLAPINGDLAPINGALSPINGDPSSINSALSPIKDDQTESSIVEAILAVALAPISSHSLSVVLPAYNEEQVIASTVSDILGVLSSWRMDFEVLVVNDGSTDHTATIVGTIADMYPQVRLVTHSTNQGYGAALVSGFTEATKELTFFMDADGQFDIRDLQQFFLFIDEYDAVIGYRIDRQDSWMRKLNAWGWKLLIDGVLGVHVRDIDCAFKLLHTEFLHQHPLETRGAMINTELLYKLARAGCCYREIGVHHHPRKGGHATGPGVILCAMRELFSSARRWRQDCPAPLQADHKVLTRIGSRGKGV